MVVQILELKRAILGVVRPIEKYGESLSELCQNSKTNHDAVSDIKRAQMLEAKAEAKFSTSRPVWPRNFNVTGCSFGADSRVSKEPSDRGQDLTNSFAAGRGDRPAMRPFVKRLRTHAKLRTKSSRPTADCRHYIVVPRLVRRMFDQ